jgi:hypothetical protein
VRGQEKAEGSVSAAEFLDRVKKLNENKTAQLA